MTGAELMLVNVFPYDVHPSRALNYEFEAYLREDSVETARAAAQRSRRRDRSRSRRSRTPRRPMGSMSSPRSEDAALIVVGSTHTGRAGRVTAGQHRRATAARLAVPRRRRPEGLRARGARASRASSAAASTARRPAQRALETAPPHRGRDRRATAGDPRLPAAGLRPAAAEGRPDGRPCCLQRQAARARLRGARRGRREARGRAARRAVLRRRRRGARSSSRRPRSSTSWSLGSRGYGPLHSVLVGGVAGRVVREAACPVIVLPRKAGHVEEDSLFAEAAPPVHG